MKQRRNIRKYQTESVKVDKQWRCFLFTVFRRRKKKREERKLNLIFFYKPLDQFHHCKLMICFQASYLKFLAEAQASASRGMFVFPWDSLTGMRIQHHQTWAKKFCLQIANYHMILWINTLVVFFLFQFAKHPFLSSRSHLRNPLMSSEAAMGFHQMRCDLLAVRPRFTRWVCSTYGGWYHIQSQQYHA